MIQGVERYCLWIEDEFLNEARGIPVIDKRLEKVAETRRKSSKQQTREMVAKPHKFGEIRDNSYKQAIVIPRVSSENREYLPVDILTKGEIISDRNFAIYDGPLWTLALIASRMHHIWIATVCVRLRSDFSYSNTLGWNTFPIPILSTDDKRHLEQSARKIIQAREEKYPATIADLYNPHKMPENLRQAHQANDQLLESLYRKKPFKSDQERLEHLFERYSKMTQTRH